MQYLLLIYGKESEREKLTETEQQRVYGEYGKLIEDLQKSGHWVGGHELQPIATASSVRVQNRKPVITDGPFAETKEQLGGYFLVEAKNLDEALSIAARIPSALTGTIEVRPVVMRQSAAA